MDRRTAPGRGQRRLYASRVKAHLVDDQNAWISDRKIRGSVSTDFAADHDLLDFARQADAIGWSYHRRGREMVGSFFLAIGGAAEGEVEERRKRGGDRAVCVDVSIPLDPTAPPSTSRTTSAPSWPMSSRLLTTRRRARRSTTSGAVFSSTFSTSVTSFGGATVFQ